MMKILCQCANYYEHVYVMPMSVQVKAKNDRESESIERIFTDRRG